MKRKLNGTVDESSSEQQFRKLDMITLLCEKFGPSASGSYSRQSDRLAVRQNSGRF